MFSRSIHFLIITKTKTMKKFRFLLVALCISAGIASFSKVKATSSNMVPLCTPYWGDACFGIPDDWGGPIGWYADYTKYNP
jgi:hypothetical protein